MPIRGTVDLNDLTILGQHGKMTGTWATGDLTATATWTAATSTPLEELESQLRRGKRSRPSWRLVPGVLSAITTVPEPALGDVGQAGCAAGRGRPAWAHVD